MNRCKGTNTSNERIRIRLMSVVVLLIALNLIAITRLSAQTVWLDQLDLTSATQGFGTPGRKTSVDGKTITIAGKTFERGFGTHAESSLVILLNRNFWGFCLCLRRGHIRRNSLR